MKPNYWSVMVACNDHRNGVFAGRAEAFDILDPDGDAAANFMVADGTPIRFDVEDGSIRLGRRFVFPFQAEDPWHGNWRWNRYWLDDDQAARMVRLLNKAAILEGGWCSLTDKIERGDLITGEVLRELAEAEGAAQ